MSLTIDILDVGQGDGILVQFPNDATMIVDLGSTKNKGIVTDDSFKFFAQHTKFGSGEGQTIDALVLTHGDRDHYNMVIPFIRLFKPKIGAIFHGGAAAEHTGADGKNLIEWIKAYSASTHGNVPTASTGTAKFPVPLPGNWGKVDVQVLCMSLEAKGDAGYVKNSRSVVLKLAYAGEVVILTGDATKDTEKHILAAFKGNLAPLQTDALKVDHHGSHRTSSYVPWIQAVNPWFLFLSADRSGALDEDQKTGHRLPQELTLDLYRRHASRLTQGAAKHNYVSSYQKSDYDAYNKEPDINGDKLNLPAGLPEQTWRNQTDGYGIFTTLAYAGMASATDADRGAHYRIEVPDAGGMTVTATDSFDKSALEGRK